ncbi:MAG: hypothetical protein H7Z72_22985 [Bacteroidetes bacterium]|nr:hypothetical protein [Fibrella sp.]
MLAGAGAASLLTSYELGRRLTPLDATTAQTLNRRAVNAFDRGATYQRAPDAAQLSDVTNALGFAGVALVSLPTLK